MHLVDAGSISTRLFCSFSVSVCKRLNFYVWFYQFFYQFSPIIIINNTFNNIFRFFSLCYYMQLKYFCFHWQVCFFFGYLCIRFGFFGAPYNGVYKFSAVFFSRCGTGNKSLLLSCQRWRTRPELCSQPAQLKRSRLHISNRLTFSSLIICLVLNGEIPNYIIKFICVRLMLQFFFSLISY